MITNQITRYHRAGARKGGMPMQSKDKPGSTRTFFHATAPGMADVLTWRPDRLAMNRRVAALMTDRSQNGAYLAVAIDNLTLINDAIGIPATNGLILHVIERLERLAPASVPVARISGDSFGLLFPGMDGVELRRLARRILCDFDNNPIETPDWPMHLSLSIGGVVFPTMARGADAVMICAEQAVREAKRRGRHIYVPHRPSHQRQQAHRDLLRMGEDVKRALQESRLCLAYQPVMDAVTGKPRFYEVLVRMIGPNGQPIAAADFIPAVERMGLAGALDRFVLDMALQELSAYPELVLSVNVSGLTAAQAAWPRYFKSRLDRAGRRSILQRLIIEITETAAVADISQTARFATALSNMGGRVALDDFGAGYTSIRHLRTLSVAILKLDRELLTQVATNPDQQTLVRMLIGLARGMGMQTVAEGIENEDTMDWLRAERVDMGQGYFLGCPLLGRPWLAGGGVAADIIQPKAASSDSMLHICTQSVYA